MHPILIGVVIVLCYLLGSIPSGLLIGYLYKVDIREKGSGNIGTTNVLRVLGPIPAGLVFAMDVLKGVLAVFLAGLFMNNPTIMILGGIAAIIGHTFSIFIKFQGGKGVATGVGVLVAIAPDVSILALILFALVVAITRYVSLGSILTSLFIALVMLLLGKPIPYSLATALMAILITAKHLPNIQRLLAGTEPKIGEKVE